MVATGTQESADLIAFMAGRAVAARAFGSGLSNDHDVDIIARQQNGRLQHRVLQLNRPGPLAGRLCADFDVAMELKSSIGRRKDAPRRAIGNAE